MLDLDFSQAEIDYLLTLEHNRKSYSNNLPITRAFPSNPKEGDVYNNTFEIYIDDAESDVAFIAGLIAAKNIPLAIAIYIASDYVADKATDSGIIEIRVTQSFLYGITNDGVLGWITGPVTSSYIY